jgi:hypothetical protein
MKFLLPLSRSRDDKKKVIIYYRLLLVCPILFIISVDFRDYNWFLLLALSTYSHGSYEERGSPSFRIEVFSLGVIIYAHRRFFRMNVYKPEEMDKEGLSVPSNKVNMRHFRRRPPEIRTEVDFCWNDRNSPFSLVEWIDPVRRWAFEQMVIAHLITYFGLRHSPTMAFWSTVQYRTAKIIKDGRGERHIAMGG